MFETLALWGISKVTAYVGGSIIGFIVMWLLNKIPKEKFYKAVEKVFYGVGVFVTAGLSKWKYTAKLWNKTIEPWVIDLLKNTFAAAINGLIRGLKSDNQ